MKLTYINQSDHCLHASCPERSVSPVVYILLYMCAAAVVLLTVCGNLLIIIFVFHFKQLHTPNNMLVLSLAVSDFLVGIIIMPSVLVWTIESCWIFGTVFCASFLLIGGFLTTLSFYNIALIAVDRYLALFNPFFYRNTITKWTMCIVVFFNWCVCLVYSITFCYFNGSFITCPGECFYFLTGFLSLIDLVISFLFPLSVIIILYSQVFLIAKKHATAIRDLNNQIQSKTHSMKSERKAAKVLGIVVSTFLICLLPYFIYSLLGYIIEPQAEMFVKLLIIMSLNSTINPVIYALFYPWFRRCVNLILTLKIFQTDNTLITVLS